MAGAYNLKSSYIFLARTNFSSYCHCFEPNILNIDNNYIKRKKIQQHITINNKILYDTDDINMNLTNDKYASTISKNGQISCNTIKLDTFFKNKENPTLIKLDIEGSEINALLGMKKIIKENKPKLQIAIYHNSNDIFKIPLLIKKLNESYTEFYLGYHSNYSWLDRIIMYIK